MTTWIYAASNNVYQRCRQQLTKFVHEYNVQNNQVLMAWAQRVVKRTQASSDLYTVKNFAKMSDEKTFLSACKSNVYLY